MLPTRWCCQLQPSLDALSGSNGRYPFDEVSGMVSSWRPSRCHYFYAPSFCKMNCEGPATNALRIQPLTSWQMPQRKVKESMDLGSLFEAADACLSGDGPGSSCYMAFPRIEWIHDDHEDEGDGDQDYSTSSLPLPLHAPEFPILEGGEMMTPRTKRRMMHRSFDAGEAGRPIKKTLRRMTRDEPTICLASLVALQQQEQLANQARKQNHREEPSPKSTKI